jgi:hypothetical protein
VKGSVRERQEIKGFQQDRREMKAKEKRRGGGGNCGQLAYGALKPRTAEAVKKGEKRDRRPGTVECELGKLRLRENRRTFVAQRSGTYTFEAKANGSKIDTVAALFDTGGKRLAYNDAASNTRYSKFQLELLAGRTYVFDITNQTGSKTGKYRAVITAPVLYAEAETGLGRIMSSGNATLDNANLRLYLYGQTKTSFDFTDHYIEVQILDLNGQPIHTGLWRRVLSTAAFYRPGAPETDFDIWNIDVSYIDLSRASRLSVVVGYETS